MIEFAIDFCSLQEWLVDEDGFYTIVLIASVAIMIWALNFGNKK